MAITTAIANSYKQEILEGVHASTDTYKIALYTSSATLDASTAAYSDTNEATGTGYDAGGKALTGFTSGIANGKGYITFSSPTWTEATITARGCLIYNSSKSNKAVVALDFGSDISSTNGTFTVNFPASGASAFIRLG